MFFTFGNHYWLQCNSMAMGTSCACAYATIYYSFHEETWHLLAASKPECSIGRLIDDAFVILHQAPNTYGHFVFSMNDFGPKGKCLEWETEPHSTTVNFLDLTILLNPSGNLKTITFQKLMNLYLYRPITFGRACAAPSFSISPALSPIASEPVTTQLPSLVLSL
jgi:hypothetical protein